MTPAPTPLSCPICGGRASRRWHGGRLQFSCSRDITCGVSGPWCGSDTDSQPDIEAEAVRMWNSVAATLRTPAPAATREMLVEVAARAILGYESVDDDGWHSRHQPCPSTAGAARIVDAYLASHPLAAPPQSAIDAAVAREEMRRFGMAVARAVVQDEVSLRLAGLTLTQIGMDVTVDRLVDDAIRARSAAKGEQ